MTAIVDPDGPLALSRRQLDDAVHLMSDPLPTWCNGTCRWADPLYARLRAALCAPDAKRGAVQRSRLPLRVDVLALLLEVDHTVAGWTADGVGGTVERLRLLAVRGWRPQDCRRIDFYTGELRRWVSTGNSTRSGGVNQDPHQEPGYPSPTECLPLGTTFDCGKHKFSKPDRHFRALHARITHRAVKCRG